MQKNRFEGLTGLKGLFSLVIVFFHTLPSTPLIDGIPLTSFVRNYGGSLGNCFFFVVSGFLISFGYRERISSGSISFRVFLVRRLRRLYPLYILSNLVSLLINITEFGASAIDLKRIIFTILLQNGGGLEAAYPYNGPSWFISALFVCYMTYFLVAYHGKNGTRYCCMVGFGIIWGYSILSGRWTAPLAFAHHGLSLFAFFTGCALAEGYPLLTEKIHRWLHPAAVVVLLGAGYLMLRYGVDIIAGDVDVAFSWIVCPLVIYLAIRNRLVSRMLQFKPIRYLGQISFSIYLWHFVLYDFFRYRIFGCLPEGMTEEWRYLLYLLVMILVSSLSHRFLESGIRSKTIA